jgi:hypothetical protein
MTHDDRPLATLTAAPPVVPPRRPIVGVEMAEDDEHSTPSQDWRRALQHAWALVDDAIAQLADIRRRHHNVRPPYA